MTVELESVLRVLYKIRKQESENKNGEIVVICIDRAIGYLENAIILKSQEFLKDQ